MNNSCFNQLATKSRAARPRDHFGVRGISVDERTFNILENFETAITAFFGTFIVHFSFDLGRFRCDQQGNPIGNVFGNALGDNIHQLFLKSVFANNVFNRIRDEYRGIDAIEG